MRGEQAVEIVEEVIAVVGIVLPGIFAVENDADHRRFVFRARRRGWLPVAGPGAGRHRGRAIWRSRSRSGRRAARRGRTASGPGPAPASRDGRRRAGRSTLLAARLLFSTPSPLAIQRQSAAARYLTKSSETAPSAGHMPPAAAPKRRAWLVRAASMWASDPAAPAGVGGGEGQRRFGQAFTRGVEVEQQRRQRMRVAAWTRSRPGRVRRAPASAESAR